MKADFPMTGVQASEIRLGVAVFGRVSGFPWWPAVVSKCPPTDDWTKDGKFWVLFFNDTTGAWLKSSEIRSFDAYNKDRCLEHNSNTPKFRRYHERLKKACTLAEKYVSNPKRIRVRVIGPRGVNGAPIGDDGEVISISDADADGADASSDAVEPLTARRIKSGKSGSKRSRALARSRDPSHDDDDENSEGENIRSGGKGRDNKGRSRRKRVRSSRYEEFIGPLEDRNTEKQNTSPSETNGKHASDDNKSIGRDPNPLHYSPPKGFRGEAGKHARAKKSKDTLHGTKGIQERRNPRPSRRVSRIAAQAAAEDLAERSRLTKRPDRRVSSRKVISKRLAHEPMRPSSNTDDDKRADAAVTREMYISELTNMVSPKALQRRRAERSIQVPSLRRSVRSRVGGSSELENTSNSEETDSEEEPERVRKVVNGSLEAAAEDLVEYAVRGERGVAGERREDILDMDSLALGGSELVCSILNRISDLERDVALFQQKSTHEEQATLGEDATAAGLKSAVEALASATAAFAKSRDYDSLVISRSLELLWSDGYFPLKGADGELLRTVARSLVMASCKRRHEQVYRERSSKKQHRLREAGKVGTSIIRQKADVREVVAVAKSGEEVANGSKEELLDGSSAEHGGQSASSEEVNAIEPTNKVLHQLEKNRRGLDAVETTMQEVGQVEEDAGGIEEEILEENAEADESEEIMDGDMGRDQDEDQDVESAPKPATLL